MYYIRFEHFSIIKHLFTYLILKIRVIHHINDVVLTKHKCIFTIQVSMFLNKSYLT